MSTALSSPSAAGAPSGVGGAAELGGGAEHTWELSKENVMPVRRGRKAAALGVVEPAPSGTTAAAAPAPRDLEAERARWEAELRSAADPLGVWVSFIRWSEEAYPSGGAGSPTLALLERCTRALKDDPRYASDARYVRVWVAYADRCHQPEEIFRFLRANEIGVRHALLWEAWAAVLEARGEWARADKVYEEGLQVRPRAARQSRTVARRCARAR